MRYIGYYIGISAVIAGCFCAVAMGDYILLGSIIITGGWIGLALYNQRRIDSPLTFHFKTGEPVRVTGNRKEFEDLKDDAAKYKAITEFGDADDTPRIHLHGTDPVDRETNIQRGMDFLHVELSHGRRMGAATAHVMFNGYTELSFSEHDVLHKLQTDDRFVNAGKGWKQAPAPLLEVVATVDDKSSVSPIQDGTEVTQCVGGEVVFRGRNEDLMAGK